MLEGHEQLVKRVKPWHTPGYFGNSGRTVIGRLTFGDIRRIIENLIAKHAPRGDGFVECSSSTSFSGELLPNG